MFLNYVLMFLLWLQSLSWACSRDAEADWNEEDYDPDKAKNIEHVFFFQPEAKTCFPSG